MEDVASSLEHSAARRVNVPHEVCLSFLYVCSLACSSRLAEMKEQRNGEMGRYGILLSESQDTRDM